MRKLCTLCPHIGDAKELEVEDAMDAEDHGESVHEFLLERDPWSLSPIFVSSPVLLEHIGGKIGIWPVTDSVVAKINSKNRKSGTVEEKPVTMDSAKYLEIITQKDGILASIKSKMPWLQGNM